MTNPDKDHHAYQETPDEARCRKETNDTLANLFAETTNGPIEYEMMSQCELHILDIVDKHGYSFLDVIESCRFLVDYADRALAAGKKQNG